MSGLEKPDELQETLESGPSRYAAFAMRLRTLITASSRYIAYTSDIGEAFRPLTNPYVVRGAYGISWAYILGDCGYAGYLAHKERQGVVPAAAEQAAQVLTPAQKVELRKRELDSGKDSVVKWNPLEASETTHVGLVVARRAVFQGIASMALPAFTIHSIVRYSAPLFAKAANPRIRASGPTVAGLAAVPALPFLFDHPVEHAVDTAFNWVEQRLAEAKGKVEEAQQKKSQDLFGQAQDRKGDGRHTPKLSVAASLALVGVGVDMVHLPRLAALVARQSRRIGSVSSSIPGSTGTGYLAAQQFARRVLHEHEYSIWQEMRDSGPAQCFGPTERQMRRLGTTWAVKEAAFKAISAVPHPRVLTWHDAILAYVDGTRRPILRYTDQLEADWRESKLTSGRPPRLHLSITHDGDYVTAFVVAE